ncbi:putative laccase [Tanacetum coccineum]
MIAIFHDMVEDFMEVFMDDFSVFDNSFDCCLANLDRMFARCEETNLVLNWEKCHFMVKEGIGLGHKISGAGIEVDRAKIDVIDKFPFPTNVKGDYSCLGTFLNPFQFSLPKRKLTMEEMVNKFIKEGKREHEEMEAFIREFRITNELLLKERNNSLSELEFEVYGFTIPCDIGNLHIDNALADLGASISLMPYTMYEKLGLGEPKPTRISLELADRSIQYPRGIVENILIKIDKFILPIDFVILDMREDSRNSIILGRPFLATSRAMIDVFNKKITLRVGDDEVTFDIDQSIKRLPAKYDECYGIDDLDKTIHLEAQELLEDDQMDSFLVNNLEKCVNQSNLENCGDFEEPIRCITQVDWLSENSRNAEVLKKCKGAIAWKMSNIKGIKDAVWIVQRARNFSKMYDGNIPRHYKIVARCEETNLVLNWEKCHFMVKEGIVLGHKISGKGIEVDKAKIDVEFFEGWKPWSPLQLAVEEVMSE